MKDSDLYNDLNGLPHKKSKAARRSEETHRRLLAVNPPNSASVGKPTPTLILDQLNIEQYDFTTQKTQPFGFQSREGLTLSADHRSLRKIIYGHGTDLDISDLIDRIPCPIQLDPDKFQRTDCWANTDKNMKAAILKVFEYTTFMNPDIITHESPTQQATYFIDKNTGVALCFHKGSKQDGKLWTAVKFDPNKISSMLQQPKAKVITDLKDEL